MSCDLEEFERSSDFKECDLEEFERSCDFKECDLEDSETSSDFKECDSEAFERSCDFKEFERSCDFKEFETSCDFKECDGEEFSEFLQKAFLCGLLMCESFTINGVNDQLHEITTSVFLVQTTDCGESHAKASDFSILSLKQIQITRNEY